jgi:hypothetical protein
MVYYYLNTQTTQRCKVSLPDLMAIFQHTHDVHLNLPGRDYSPTYARAGAPRAVKIFEITAIARITPAANFANLSHFSMISAGDVVSKF